MVREVTKTDMLRVRMSVKDGEMIDHIAEEMGVSRSEATRRLIWEAFRSMTQTRPVRPRKAQKAPKAAVLEPPAGATPPDRLAEAAARLKQVAPRRPVSPMTKEQSAR